MNETITIDDLSFQVRRSNKRRTLEIIVDRDGSLVVASPTDCNGTVISDFVREKRFWIYTKLAEKDALQAPVVTKEFVSGEGFPYLGRSHRLLVVDEHEWPLRLYQGRFMMPRSAVSQGRRHFIDWYTEHAKGWITDRTGRWASRAGVEPAGVRIQDLGFRWGSCGQGGVLNFHWATILLPPEIVDYVIVHELAHLQEPKHTPEFWLRVERVQPDYDRRKKWLAEHGASLISL